MSKEKKSKDDRKLKKQGRLVQKEKTRREEDKQKIWLEK